MAKTAPDDTTFMQRALALAARARGRVEPNPMVGCVIVRGGRIIGEGYHRRFGGAHAEIEALHHCAGSARGATVYVTLEPCCYHGKTPPCTDALLSARVGRVVAAMRDPNPAVAGRGLRILRRAGVDVQVGLLRREAAELNAPFAKLMRHRRPWVILKWAQSVDGKIATATGDSKWITDDKQRAHAHQTRGRVDAILVGSRTAEIDDPLLTCRAQRPRRIATRIVLDPLLTTPLSARLVQTARDVPTWFFCTSRAARTRARRLEAAGCVVHRAPAGPRSTTVALPAVLDVLGRHQMTNLLVEGGGAVLSSLFREKLADELHVYVGPRLIGGRAAVGPLDDAGADRLSDAITLPPRTSLKRLGGGWLVQTRL